MPRLLKVFGQTKGLCRFRQGSFSFFGPVFFLFFTQGLFSAFDFSRIVSVDNFHVGILSSTSGPIHTKTIVNANASKRKLFYAKLFLRR